MTRSRNAPPRPVELPCDRCGAITWLTLAGYDVLCGPCAQIGGTPAAPATADTDPEGGPP